jgi:multidrug resistance efflux pump
MADDFKVEAAVLRAKQLYADRKRLEAHLAAAENDGSLEYAAECIQEIADLDAQGERVNRLYQQHVQSQQPRYRAPDTGMEFMGKPVEKMGGDDALRIINAGKMPGDPTALSAEDYNRQYHELQRLKAQGMHKD